MKFIIQIIACFNFFLLCGTGCVCYNFSPAIDLLCYPYRVASETVEFLSDKHDNKYETPNFKISHLIYSHIGEYPEKVRKTGGRPRNFFFSLFSIYSSNHNPLSSTEPNRSSKDNALSSIKDKKVF
ncbi:MAG: hypothetical protein K9G70_10530 [Prolixibacteraceae bacterium]|nr:hypothetical protein [Prolixibacteraceae bacterium]